MNPTTTYVLSILFLATLIRSAFGFGEALVAVPLLLFRIPATTAVPLAVLTSVLVAAVVIIQDHQHIHVRSAAWLVAATLLGTPLGLWLLAAASPHLVKSILALFILSFSSFCLLSPTPPHLTADRKPFLLLAGFLAGVFGGAYGMNGPPLVVYGSLRRWSPQHFRATLQAYFLPASLAGLTGYFLAGLLTPAVLRYFLLSLPLTLAATLLGRSINRRLKGHSVVHLALILIAITLLVQSATH